MLRRVGSAYLWLSPIAFIPLAAVYHAVDFRAGIAAGLVHLALVLVGLRANRAITRHEDASGSRLGPTLLVLGGAVVWATGPSGPPNPKDLSVATFNQAGLTLGFFITLLGFAASREAFVSVRERALSGVATSSFALTLVLWIIGASLGMAVYRSPLINIPPAQRPDAFGLLRDFSSVTFIALAISGYLGGLVIADAAIRSGWVRRRAGLLLSIFSLVGILAFPLGQHLLSPAAAGGVSLREVPWLAWLTFPWLPPAMMCLVPYYVGVLGLSHAAQEQSTITARQAVSFTK